MQELYKLYGVSISYYTAKARSYLRYKGIPYEEIFSDLKQYKKFIVPRTGQRMIPVVQTPDDTVIQDTTDIIDTLEQRFPARSVYPSTPKQKLASLLLELWGDEWLVLPAMHYRWNYLAENSNYIFAEFGRVAAPWAPAFIRRLLGKKISGMFSGMVPNLGITPATHGAIEASWLQTMAELDKHFASHSYLFGEQASIADFGLIGPIYAHLYLDPAPGAILRAEAPQLCQWIERMQVTSPPIGSWLAGDVIPETLIPILQRLGSEQIPVLEDTAEQLAQWVKNNPHKTKVSRIIGRHNFTLGESQAERMVLPYSLWMLQRAQDYYQSLAPAEQDSMQPFLTDIGALRILNQPIRHRLKRQDNQLILV